MAEITTLEEKLAEVTGLAQAAQVTIDEVSGMIDDAEISSTLETQKEEAAETERRATDLIDQRDNAEAIREKAGETKDEATEMMRTYLGDESDGLDGLEFMIMAEAGEVGHWAILGKLNETAGESGIRDLVDWAAPIQERHFTQVREASLALAAEEDPNETS